MINIKIDKIIRSKRRTLAFEVTRDARLIVRAPERTPLDFIEKIVFKKHFWIHNKQKLAKETYHQVQPKEFVNGEGFLYLGNTYRLYIVDESNPPVLLEQEFRLSREYLPKARELFIDWYKKQAEQKIKERVDWYSNLFGFKYNRFSITNAQKRWGSCSAKDNLHFSWRLIMAPLSVIDYVVVHELVHVERKNHSQEFWKRIKIIIPNYQESRIWLKENEHRLVC